MAENLNRLNQLLKTLDLGVPDFRRTVDSSGSNLKWLKKAIFNHPNCTDELKCLLNMNPKELLSDKG